MRKLISLILFSLFYAGCRSDSSSGPDADQDAGPIDAFIPDDRGNRLDRVIGRDATPDVSDQGGSSPPLRILVTTGPSGPGNRNSLACAVSSTPEGSMGPVVAVIAGATNMVSGFSPTTTQVYARDFSTGIESSRMEPVSLALDAVSPGDGTVGGVGLSLDTSEWGNKIFYEAGASTNLVVEDLEGHNHILLRLRSEGRNQLASRAAGGEPADGDSFGADADLEGRSVAFQTTSSRLTGIDGGSQGTVVKDTETEEVEVASRNSAAPVALSGDARWVASIDPLLESIRLYERGVGLAPSSPILGGQQGFNRDGSTLSFIRSGQVRAYFREPGVEVSVSETGQSRSASIASDQPIIAFDSINPEDISAGLDVLARSLLTASPVLITDVGESGEPIQGWSPRTAPDGKSLCYLGPDASGITQVWLVVGLERYFR